MSEIKSAVMFGAVVVGGLFATAVAVIFVEVAQSTPDGLSFLILPTGLILTGYISLRLYRREPTVNGVEASR
jgi:hypothetical protein